MNAVVFPSNRITPEVGMGATICFVSDRHGATVMKIVSPRIIEVVEDEAKLVGGNMQSENQVYEHSPAVPPGRPQRFTLRKTGHWIAEHEPLRGGTRLVLGTRDTYWDPSF
jgi:hypothetical protein